MPQKFRISASNKVGDFNLLGKWENVPADIFWNCLHEKVKQLTVDNPDQFSEVLEKAKTYIQSQTSTLTIEDTCFEIKGKP